MLYSKVGVLAFAIASVAVVLDICSLAIKITQWHFGAVAQPGILMGGRNAKGVEGVLGEVSPSRKIFSMSFGKRVHFRAFYALLNRPKSVTVN